MAKIKQVWVTANGKYFDTQVAAERYEMLSLLTKIIAESTTLDRKSCEDAATALLNAPILNITVIEVCHAPSQAR